MTNDEFRSVCREQLGDVYGDKAYPPGILQRLWFIVGRISAGEFRQALDNLSMTATRAPNIAQIKGACLQAITKANDDAKREKIAKMQGESPCAFCLGGGWCMALSRSNATIEVAFICTKCEAARILGFKDTRGARYWADGYESEYVLRGPVNWGDTCKMQAAAFRPMADKHKSQVEKQKSDARMAEIEREGKRIDTMTRMIGGPPYD